jgi:secernin
MCDTFVALSGHTADGSIVFGKNSDRDPNEAQALEWHPPREYPAGTEVQCTYLRIPQARRTNGVLISRPHWIWGAEMGANDRGVVIGNEAVFTRRERSATPGLIGMDHLRLALERADSARAALDTITELLARYGQTGKHGPRVYHNSFLIADPEGAWVLETAGEFWAAKRVQGYGAISNGLTIGAEFDESSPGLADAARKLGLLRRGADLDFAQCFADPFYRTFIGCRPRRSRALAVLGAREGRMSVGEAFALLRDHGKEGGEYRPDGHFLMSRICSHAANAIARDSAQSTGSLVASMKGTDRTFWATGTSAPCTGLFKPVWLEGDVLPDLGPTPGPTFDEASLWWRHERMHRTALRDLPRALAMLAPERDALEREVLQRVRASSVSTAGTRGEAGDSSAVGDSSAGTCGAAERFALTDEAFRHGRELDERMLARFEGELRRRAKLPLYGSFWRKKNGQAGIRLAV